MRLLIVEDDLAIAEPLLAGLRHHGFDGVHVSCGADAVRSITDDAFDVVLLDLGLPDMDGLDVCREIRKLSSVPVIMVTARDEEIDRIVGLELGADDYVSKPFGIRELIARIRAVRRRFDSAAELSNSSANADSNTGPNTDSPSARSSTDVSGKAMQSLDRPRGTTSTNVPGADPAHPLISPMPGISPGRVGPLATGAGPAKGSGSDSPASTASTSSLHSNSRHPDSRQTGSEQATSVQADKPTKSVANSTLTIGKLVVDHRTHRVHLDGVEIALTPKEFGLLVVLGADPGAVVPRMSIIEQVWDEHWYGPTKTLDVHVAQLRQKLGNPGWIETVRGVGYRLADPALNEAAPDHE
jgi:DNA-binding response OmpR family regulator